MTSSPRAALFALGSLLLGACAANPGFVCASGESAAVNELVYFGRATPAGDVSEEDWTAFLRDEVTPRFPAGLSVWEAAGQWQGTDGGIVRESSFVLNLLHPPSEGEADIAAIMNTYKTRFQQEAVLRVRSPACTSL